MIGIAFILNCLCNFGIGIVVAKILGPAEFGRYSLAISTAIVLQTLGFDWLRLSALRFYSTKRHAEQPDIRATLDLTFTLLAGGTLLVALGIALSGVRLPLAAELLPISIAVAVAISLFETSAAFLRAGFENRAYGVFVITKNILALGLSIGAASYFGSARMALAGLIASIAGSFVINRLAGHKTRIRLAADRRLVVRFAAYGFPIVIANAFYQAIPMIDRGLVSQVHDFAQAGQMALAFDIGLRAIGSIGAVLDILLFQLAVAADHERGAAAASRQVARNMGIVIAVLLPAIAGLWLVLPSFEALLIPQGFREPFAHYFTLMLPALLCSALINYCFNQAFQIQHRTAPLICGGVVAFVVNGVAIVLLPASADASTFVVAQSLSAVAGLATIVAFFWKGRPIWPPARDVLGALLGVAVMAFAVAPFRQWQPGVATLLLQGAIGGAVYAAIVTAGDVAGTRTLLIGLAKARLARRPKPSREPAAPSFASETGGAATRP